MKRLLIFVLLLSSFIGRSNYLLINPPVITATGNQIYCIGTSIKIVQSISITNDPAGPDTDAIYIQISSGYINGQDQLTLTNPSAHPTITTSWDAAAGKLKLYSPTGIKVTYTDFESAIRDIEFSNSSPSASGIRNFSITIGQANYLPSTTHYYQYISSIGITWTAAKAAAELLNYYGLKGYLATLLSLDEAKLSGEQASGAGWIGGSDAALEGEWRWVTGPEGLANGGTGIVFWNGGSGGSTPNFAYWNTNNGEPNNLGDEDYAHITAPGIGIPGSWNDLSNTGNLMPGNAYQPKGYIVEFGGMPGDPTLQISASTTITIPKITSTTPNSRCGSGILSLQATASNGVINWYTTSTGGTPIATGNSFTTPGLTTTTSYFVDATNGNCTTRTEIIATINPIPTIVTTTPNSRCDSGTVTLGATTSTGTVNWYNAPTGGILLGTGTTFTTPNISTTTTFYADATANGCTTPSRTAITATINVSPSISSTTSASRCDTGSVSLGATASAGIINWYDVPTGGTSLATGTTFITPTILATTTYYVEAVGPFCTSPSRTAIKATIYPIPIITSTTPASRCDAGTVNLQAIASIGTISWYTAASGGSPIASGNTFTTATLNNSTTFFVEASANGCKSPTRTAITATVNTTPTILSTTPASRCDTGTVTLQATSSAGTINWYDSSGNIVAVGSSFTTPELSTTTTYYVDAAVSGCNSPKIAVIATVYPINTKTEEVLLCQGETVILDASIPGMNYLWSPSGETTQTIVASTIGDYSVIISSPNVASCDSNKFIKVIEHNKPIIKEIIVNENSIKIELEVPQNYFEYSINGTDFQKSNEFSYIQSGNHTAYVREKNGCNLVQQDFTIFTIAKYFTPNNDGYNDLWEIKEMKNFPNSSVDIFNRYGKLLKQLNPISLGWDGTFNGVKLPADDYWYQLKLDDSIPVIKGHFSLKR